ncbi:50S ribosomal protein L19 [Patescibacteria group bacterium]|nr:50S ribosomal protein L19 [Patescibacteria group bacterium]
MTTKIETFLKPFLKKEIPDIRPGDTIRVYQKIKEALKKSKPSMEQEYKERIQIFEGQVIAKKHGKGISGTITVRKVISGVGVERIFPLHSPTIEKIEIIKRGKARRAKLYYLRKAKGKKTKVKRREVAETTPEKPVKESDKEATKEE